MNLDNKTIVLTGAASGIGKEVLKKLSGYNCNIVAVDKDSISFGKSDVMGNAKISKIKLDIGNKKNVDKLFEYLRKNFKKIDVFIANAGFAYYEEMGKPDWERIENIYKTNVFSPIYSLQKMNEQDSPFLFVVTSSSIGFLGIPGYSLYSSTKSALVRFFEAYRFEKNKNCKILEVFPIGTKTNFFKNAGKDVPMLWIMQEAEYVADKIAKSIISEDKKLFPSKLFRFAFFLNKFFPFILKFYQWEEFRKFKKWVEDNEKKKV